MRKVETESPPELPISKAYVVLEYYRPHEGGSTIVNIFKDKDKAYKLAQELNHGAKCATYTVSECNLH